MDKFNMGVMGTGIIAAKMAAAINGLEEVNAYAAASRDLSKAQKFAEEWGFETYYGSYEEMVQDSDINLIYVATPHPFHYENAKLCMEHGKSVLVEKPFTVNAKQAKKLLDLAKEKGVFLAEAIWTRYMPGVSKIKDIIAAGRIGQVEFVEADLSAANCYVERLHNPALAGGALLDLGVYTLTFASLFLGEEVVSVRSRCLKYETGVDATDHIEFTYRDGRQAFLRTSMVSASRSEGKIIGTRGYIEVSGLNKLDKIRIYDAYGKPQETWETPLLVNGYEYEVLACKKAIEAGLLECEEMPHTKILTIMEQMDNLRAAWGLRYPFE